MSTLQEQVQYRNEQKFFMNAATAAVLRSRASAVMRPDSHSGGRYIVNNLYLDDQYNSFYHEKMGNRFSRDKYRVRFYNHDLSFIRFERKHKDGEHAYKQSVAMTKEEYHSLANGDLAFAFESEHPLWQKVALLHRLRRMRPTAAYYYSREAYIYEPGNVRVTFDSHLRQDAVSPEINPGAPPGEGGMLEVKFDRFLPTVIKELLHGLPLVRTEMSKYAYSFERSYFLCLNR
ncbi:MAG: polyphosphate polymerase domain-containing protein [Oscillospiraceae bacterium]|nr:polyphosphate polymerase domain-containing protein [Oscillospiraceae bacterium]